VSGYSQPSPQHDRIFGYPDPVPEWNLATFLDHVLAEDRTAAGMAFLDAMTTGGLAFECRITRADGEIRWIAVKGRADFGDYPTAAAPIPVRMISVVRDVTASRQAQELLRNLNQRLEERVSERTRALAQANTQVTREVNEREQSEARFAAAFRLASVPMMVCLLAGFRILDVNEAFAATLGHPAADAVGRLPDDLKLWDKSAARRRFEQDIQAAGRVRNLDARLTTKTGWLLDCLASAEIVTIEGQVCVLIALQDITERKRSEAELFAAIEAVMQDTSWFSRTVIEKLAQLRHPERSETARADLADLTPRERDVLGLLCEGRKAEDMARKLGLSRNTVRNHLATLYQKIGAHGRSEAIIWARERGVTGAPRGKAAR
jgi:PAS domain S-box-containing protein